MAKWIIIPATRVICVNMARKKLLEQVSEVARFRHLSLRTEETYRNGINRFILFHQKQHPAQLGADAIRAFLTHLAVNEHVAASTQNQAFNALLFLYKQILQVEALRIEGSSERGIRGRCQSCSPKPKRAPCWRKWREPVDWLPVCFTAQDCALWKLCGCE